MLFRQPEKRSTTYTLQDAEFLNVFGLDPNSIDVNKLGEITYFVCLKHLTETMSKLPLKIYKNTAKGKEKIKQHYIKNILNLEPNPYYTASTLWGSCELNKNHHGNAYIYIETHKIGRNAGRVKHLWILPSNQMQIWIDDAGYFGKPNGIWYIWTDIRTNKQYKFSISEIMHIKTSVSFDGITGLAVKDILKLQIETAQYGQSFLSKLYQNNMFGGKVILHYTGNLETEGEQRLAKKIEKFSNSVGSGKFIPLPLGITAQSIDMKLSDAEFAELNKINALQIASAFGIKPNILNNYEKSSYSNSETQQLDFYVNSLLPILRQYEQEITRKLLTTAEKENEYYFEFNPNIIFRTDFKTQVEALSKAVNNFEMTPNEAREKLGLPWIEGGDHLIGNGNYIKLDQVGTQWNTEGGEENNE